MELTFLFIGLPAYVQDLPSTLYDGKNDTSLPLMRLAQRESGSKSYPRNFQTSLIDHGYLFGHYGSIHPMDKTPVGKRLMLSAAEHAYGEAVNSAGPEPLTATGTASVITLTFECKAPCLLLRTSGAVRQECPLGEKQVS